MLRTLPTGLIDASMLDQAFRPELAGALNQMIAREQHYRAVLQGIAANAVTHAPEWSSAADHDGLAQALPVAI